MRWKTSENIKILWKYSSTRKNRNREWSSRKLFSSFWTLFDVSKYSRKILTTLGFSNWTYQKITFDCFFFTSKLHQSQSFPKIGPGIILFFEWVLEQFFFFFYKISAQSNTSAPNRLTRSWGWQRGATRNVRARVWLASLRKPL